MTFRKLTGAFVVAATLLAGGSAFAQTQTQGNGEFFPFAEVMAMKMMDKNKDGMVSKKEFMDMMTMVWDMNAKKMGIKGDKMTEADFKQILMYLKAGG